MADPDPDFAALVEHARAGDREALAQLVGRYEPQVRVIARVLLGASLRPYLDSIDVVQSVHRMLLTGLRAGRFDFSAPEQLVALAATLLRRKVARQWRHLRKQERPSRADPVGHPSGPPEPRTERDLDPAREAEFRDGARKLFARLGETERQILALRMHGHSTDEVAARLGLNPITLRVRITRLRKRLEESGALADWL